jgi:ABC-2 type transport system permease protein
MSGFRVLLWKEMLEQRRTMRFWAIVILFLVAGLISPLIARYTPEIIKSLAGSSFQLTVTTPTTLDAIDQLLKNLGQFGALAAILTTMSLVAGEKERGTAGMILTKPVSRGAFLAAKFVAIGITLLVGTATAGVAAYAYTSILFTAPDLQGFVLLCVLVWLSLLVYAALTFLGSTVAGSAAAAGGLGFVGVLAAGILSVLPTIGPYMPAALAGAGRLYAVGQTGPDVVGPSVANVGFVVLALLLSNLAFRRQEL